MNIIVWKMLIANKSSQQVSILLCRFSQPPASTGNSTQPMGILLHNNRLGPDPRKVI